MFVEGSLSGGQFVLDQAHAGLNDRGRVLWGGRSGGKALHTPDAYITYQVQVDSDMRGDVVNEALVSIEGRRSYSLKAQTALPVVEVALSAPNYVGVTSPIRYSIKVTNRGAVALTNLEVTASWTGGAYIEYPNPESWAIPELAAGAEWNRQFTLWTFSTASGQVVASVEVSHPWIGTATATANTTIVR